MSIKTQEYQTRKYKYEWMFYVIKRFIKLSEKTKLNSKGEKYHIIKKRRRLLISKN